MPQLDKVSYFTQFFWLCFFYVSFYLVLVKFYLPKIRKILKVREKKAGDPALAPGHFYDKEKRAILGKTEESFVSGLKLSRDALQQSYEASLQWTHQVTDATNAQQLQPANTAYVGKMKTIAASFASTLHDLKHVLPPVTHVQCGFTGKTSEKRESFVNLRIVHALLTLQPKTEKKHQKKAQKQSK